MKPDKSKPLPKRKPPAKNHPWKSEMGEKPEGQRIIPYRERMGVRA